LFQHNDFDVGSGDEVFVREDGTQFIGQAEETWFYLTLSGKSLRRWSRPD